jgi:sugar O-acyltransferase (sialic acid O-acetyltransferase NeuD family)
MFFSSESLLLFMPTNYIQATYVFAGFGGHALELMDAMQAWDAPPSVFGCYVLPEAKASLSGLNLEVFCDAPSLQAWCGPETKAVLATGNPSLRRQLFEELSTYGISFTTVGHGQAVCSPKAVFGEALNLMAFSFVGPFAHLETGVLLNVGASVHHGAKVGAFSEIGPGARVLGEAIIGEGCLIGAQATILPGIQLGNGVRVGAGAVVTKDVSPGKTVVGVPAIALRG